MSYIRIKNLRLDIPVLESTVGFTKKTMKLNLGGVIKKNNKTSVVTALDDIDLDINNGDSLALIGHNGAGKSTLLRVIAGLFVPTSGSIEVQGNISSLLTLGMGIDYELSGYENIFLMGLILGMPKKLIRSKIDDIIEFTELGEFIGFPVKTYSAGMATRLAFAVATAIDPEILVLDEGIGAGDAHFIHKAQKRTNDLCKNTDILIIASHDTSLLRSLCNKAILLEHGRIIFSGPVDDALSRYDAHF